jgi:D-proline reductase (dithiol) PrdB
MSTITLSNIPVLTASAGAPRIAAVEYPIGRTVGAAGDSEGQSAVLRETMRALEEIDRPGGVVHLPFEWPESPQVARKSDVPPPPIVNHLKRRPWLVPRLLNRTPPEGD